MLQLQISGWAACYPKTSLPAFIRPADPEPYRLASLPSPIFPTCWVCWVMPKCSEQPADPGGPPFSWHFSAHLHHTWGSWTIQTCGYWTIQNCRLGNIKPKDTHYRPATTGPSSFTPHPNTYCNKNIQGPKSSRWLKALERTPSTKARILWHHQSTATSG